ncbi:hypothetical protein AJ80_09595 [Polytolypa hystricis UAMH7299]|uniref:Protein ROT1 n=1 Tax=Polytolypa hystricis (strain UAMH7299) TaxID=1447883 RepID=A0A2B7WN45_POLH7|nr:hypothetical protein AJ80_09595 [Polytolypa hystricis UAMH7299]
MMLAAPSSLLFLLASISTFLSLVGAQVSDSDLVGTWTTKSRKVITGPDFYDPINDKFTEPSHTGISYSFTADGFYESAYYRAISNPTRPSCAQSVLQFQHGKYTKEANGSLILTPFAIDGRQLISNPCKGKYAQYYRYNQTELFKRYVIETDKFHNVKRLNLYQFDGAPLNPMFLIYDPPQMLPTKTLNPVPSSPSGKAKRGVSASSDGDFEIVEPLNKNAWLKRKVSTQQDGRFDHWWWFGVIMTSIGGVVVIYSEFGKG